MPKPPTCAGCPLEIKGEGWVPHTPGGPILLVGEAPGETEARTGTPFAGQAGWMLNRILSRVGINRAVLGVHNCLSCRPPHNWLAGAPYEYQALSHCHPNLLGTIDRLRPKVIVALGNVALRQLTGKSGILGIRGYPLPGPRGIWVVPTLHPSFLLPRAGQKDTSRLQGAVMLDLKKAEHIAQAGFHYETPELLLDPDPHAFGGYVDQAIRSGAPLSVDIETPGKIAKDEEDLDEGGWNNTIIRIGFAFERGRALSIPFTPPYLEGVKRLLLAGMPKILWNGYAFDWPILGDHGFTLGGEVHDGMWAWKFLQSDLPRGLQSAGSFYAAELGPWKYLSSVDPARYNALDALVAWRIFDGIRKDLTSQGRYGVYDRHTRVAWEVLRQAGQVNGLTLRGEGREILKERLEKISIELLLEAQRQVPSVFHAGKTFARKPKDLPTVPIVVTGKERHCTKCGKSGKLNGKHPCGQEFLEEREIPVEAHRVEVPWEAGAFEGLSLEELDRLIAVGGFNPDSPEQMKAYARAHKHPLRFDHKRGSDSLDKLQLEKLAARHGEKHPIYRIVQDLRGVSKTLGTYVNGFAPDPEGKIYTTYTFGASTGRLTSRAVNLQNVSHRSENEWAEHIRRMIVPRAGRVFVEADSSAIEAVFVGFFAGDPEYMERAKLGIHAYLACVELGLEFTPENVKAIKGSSDPKIETLYARKKRTVHGCFLPGHELLTPEGWKAIETIPDGTPVAAWAPDGTITFQTPSQWVRKEVDEEVLLLEGEGFSAITTADHRWPVLTSQGNIRDYYSAELPKANALPGVGTLSGGRPVDERFIQRLVAIQADGTYASRNTVRFHVKKRRKVQRLVELGAEIASEGKRGDVYLTMRCAEEEIAFLGPEKTWDFKKLAAWDLAARETLLDELPQWDGDQKRIYRTSRRDAMEAIQAVGAISGRRGRATFVPASPGSFGTKGYWMVSVKSRRKAISLECLRRNWAPYEGMVYCPSVASGYVVFRCGVDVGISGNCNFGMGPKLMAMQYPRAFPSVKVAQREVDFYYSVCPKLKEWHDHTQLLAHRQAYLQNPFGYRHYFYDVLKKDPTGKVVYGSDAKRVLAFLPQSSAAAFMRESLARLRDSEWFPESLPANLSIHDALIIEPREEEAPRARDYLVDLMNRPIPEMGGLRIGVDVKIYRANWQDSEKFGGIG